MAESCYLEVRTILVKSKLVAIGGTTLVPCLRDLEMILPIMYDVTPPFSFFFFFFKLPTDYLLTR